MVPGRQGLFCGTPNAQLHLIWLLHEASARETLTRRRKYFLSAPPPGVERLRRQSEKEVIQSLDLGGTTRKAESLSLCRPCPLPAGTSGLEVTPEASCCLHT